MATKKGMMWNLHLNDSQADMDYIWFELITASEKNYFFDEQWKKMGSSPQKRGILFRPMLLANDQNVKALASSHCDYYMHVEDRDNGVPFIVDPWRTKAEVSKGYVMLDIDRLYEYLTYFTNPTEGNTSFKVKPLLRVASGWWNNFAQANKNRAAQFLDVVDILLYDPDAIPSPLEYVALEWWEQEEGIVHFDSSGIFSKVIEDSQSIEEPSEDEVPVEEPAEPVLVEVLWRGPKLGSMRLAIIREEEK